MKIYLMPNTAGRYGGGLNGNLKYFHQLIQDSIDNAGFTSSFDELWLTLSYPPMYVLPGVVGIEIDYRSHYDKLPYSRLDRRYKKLEVILKAPEFSEHFDKQELSKFKDQFDINSSYKNISETELAKILIDKYLLAGDMVRAKLSKDDIFDIELYKSTLLSIRQNITDEFISLSTLKLAEQVKNKTIQDAINLREQRAQTNKLKDKLIRDLRVYYSGLPRKAFYPYDYQYTEIFLNLLKRNGLMCPTYHHLYVMVGRSIEECLQNSYAFDERIIYGLSVIDYDKYLDQTAKEKENMVFDLIVNGINDIAVIDKLDYLLINKTIEHIKQKGLDTELIHQIVENKKHQLTISYFSRSMEEECPIYFTLLEKSSNKFKRIQIGRATNSQIYFWLQKVTITNTQIKVKSSTSIEADVNLKDKVRTMEFNIKDLLNE